MGVALSICVGTNVSPPKPIDVKKLIANLVFLGLSRGSIPSNAADKNL